MAAAAVLALRMYSAAIHTFQPRWLVIAHTKQDAFIIELLVIAELQQFAYRIRWWLGLFKWFSERIVRMPHPIPEVRRRIVRKLLPTLEAFHEADDVSVLAH